MILEEKIEKVSRTVGEVSRMKRKNYIVFVRHLKSIKDLVDFYEYIAGSKSLWNCLFYLLFNHLFAFHRFAIPDRIHRALFL